MSINNKQFSLSPKEFAHLVGVSPSTVRRWEDEGVFTSVRSESGYRRYSLSDIEIAKKHKEDVSELKKQKSQMQIFSGTGRTPSHNSALFKNNGRTLGLLSAIVIGIFLSGSLLWGTAQLFSGSVDEKSPERLTKGEDVNSEHDVLAAETNFSLRQIISNIGWDFRSKVQIEELQVDGGSIFLGDIDATDQNLTLGAGRLTASNVLYSLNVGNGLSLTGGRQTPTISNTGVLSFNGLTGTLEFAEGSGISIDGLEITNNDPGTAQNIFKNIKVGSTTITAGSNDDSLTFEQGSGVTLTANGKTITISSIAGGFTSWDIAVDGSTTDTVADGDTVDFVSGNDISVTRTASNQLNIGIEDVLDTVLGINLPVGGYITGSNATITFDNFSVDASGNVLIAPGGDVVIGGTRLSGTGPTSGATLIGVNGGSISQAPAGGTLQSVLESISASIGGGSSKWSVVSNVLYPIDYATSNFALGGTTPTTSPFGVNINSNTVYIGDGANDANTPQILFKASDGATSGTLSYVDGGGFVLTGGGVTTDGIIYAGSGVQAITLANGLLNPSAIPLITSGTTATSSSISGLEVVSNQIGLIRGCTDGQVLKWNSGSSSWTCSNDTAGSSAVTDVLQDGATPAGSPDAQFGSINFIQNFSLVENTAGVIDVNLASNIGIGTAPSGSYALTINGAANMTSLYLAGTQVTATADEINLLDGRSGTLLDTANVGTQLSGWDQNAGDDVTAFTGLSDTPGSYVGQGTRLVRVNAGATGLEFVDATSVGTNYWDRNSGSGYIYPAVLTDRVGIGKSTPGEMLDIEGNIAVSGTVDGRDIATDGSALDNLNTTIGLSALTSAEVDQLENIGTTSITSAQWVYLGALDQGLATTNAVTFTTINTGNGDNELYAMNQNVRTSDTVQFAGLQIGGVTPTISSIVSGTGNNWSTASDTAIVTQEAIKDYVGTQISGSALTYENGLTQVGSTVVFGGELLNNTRLYAGAQEVLYLNTSSGNIGIGTTSPGSKLDVAGTAWLRGGTANNTGLFVNSSGYVGIGTTNPGDNLTMYGEGQAIILTTPVTNSSNRLDIVFNEGGGMTTSTGFGFSYNGAGSGNNNYVAVRNFDIGADLIAFNKGGSVGIGTTSPLDLLHVKSTTTNAGLILDGRTAYDSQVRFWENGASRYAIGLDGATGNFIIGTTDVNTGQRLVISSSGNVGIGTTSVGSYLLNVNGDIAIASGSDLYIGGIGLGSTATSSTSGASLIGFWGDGTLNYIQSGTSVQSAIEILDTQIGALAGGQIGLWLDNTTYISPNNTDAFAIFDNGRVGIGQTSAAAATLDVSGTAWLRGGTGNTGLFVDTNGRIGLGKTDPSYSLDSTGSINIATGSSYYINGISVLSSGSLGSGVVSSSLTSVGTLTSGTWNAATITEVYGGTGKTSFIEGDILVGNNSSGLNTLGIGGIGQVLTSNGTTPVWQTVSGTGIVSGTGTSNYLSRWVDSSTIGNSGIYESGGNIGIGTTDVASYLVNIAGSLNVTSLNIGGTAVTSTASELNFLDNSTVTNGGIVFGNGTNFTQDGANFFWNNTTKRLGIGTTAPSDTLDLFGTTAGLRLSYDASNYGKFTIGNDGTLTLAGVSGGGSLTTIARFATTGVDIDVPTSFNATGDVTIANDLLFSNQAASYIKTLGPLTIEAGENYESNNLKLKTYNNGNIVLDAAGGVALNQAQDWDLAISTTALNIASGLLNIDTTNSRVGIGTTSPQYMLDVNGDTRIATGSDLYIGSIGLGATGSSNTTSGGSLIGLYDEFANSNSTNVQDVIDDLDAQVSYILNAGTYDRVVDATGGGTDTTIQSAITNASSGDVIFIRAGTYNENLTI